MLCLPVRSGISLGCCALALLLSLLNIPISAGQSFDPWLDETFTTVKSPVDDNVTIRYKIPPVGTCTTVFATQKQYSGYITLPPNVLSPGQGNYSIKTFFWFFEARQLPETAPLTVFINGGPGSSSMVGLFQEVGPCQVVEVARQRLGTVPRDWGWDRSSNILFIDQPVQVGFSFDSLRNASLDLLKEGIIAPPTTAPSTQPAYTYLNGTFSSGDPAYTANTSEIAAQALWHFLQTFLITFPQYSPNGTTIRQGTKSSMGIDLFTESYGGKYGTAAAIFFAKQNALRRTDGNLASKSVEVTVNSLGIINGWFDLLVQMPFYPRFAYNNSYGIRAISQLQQINALNSFDSSNGCQQQTLACRAQEDILDPESYGNSETLNDICAAAQTSCVTSLVGPYTSSGRSIYDISQNLLDPFPRPLYLEYLNLREVREGIGAQVNFTQSSQAVSDAFASTGDYARSGVIQDLANVLRAGTRIALIYGDRDYICNWLGGEAVSFAIAGAAGAAYQGWYASGYAPIVTNNTYIGGVVREFGNLSFSRIYDAGHLVPSYQPETAFTVFSRVIQGTGISLGREIDLSSSGTLGNSNSSHTNQAPPAASPICFVRAIDSTCNRDQKNKLANGAGVIINGVLYDEDDDWQAPPASISVIAGFPGNTPPSMLTPTASSTNMTSSTTSSSTAYRSSGAEPEVPPTTTIPTGVFTATGIPSIVSTSTQNAASAILDARQSLYETYPYAFLVMVLGLWDVNACW